MTVDTKVKYKVYTDDKSRALIAKSRHGFMGISVGSHFQSGRRLSAVIDFILKNFDETPFTFYLCDSLKAHNISALKELSY